MQEREELLWEQNNITDVLLESRRLEEDELW